MSYNSNYGTLQQRYYQNMDGFQLSQISQTSPQYLKYNPLGIQSFPPTLTPRSYAIGRSYAYELHPKQNPLTPRVPVII